MSEYIINDAWIREYESNIEELIGFDIEYDSATNPTPPLRKVDGTRWHEMFGTPERAARTLASLDEMSCKYCLLRDHCGDSCLLYRRDDALLEWLIRSDA